MDKLFLVIPCYNEEAVLPETAKRLAVKMAALVQSGEVSPDSRILLVDDGSRDKTWEIIKSLHEASPVYMGVKLAKNAGHQRALMAGLLTAEALCDVSISMDADLQDDIDTVDKMLAEYKNGCDVVYGVRSSRGEDTAFKRLTAEGFYKFMKLMGVDTVFNHADYRLMSSRALAGLKGFREVNLYLRGVVPLIGFKSGKVFYERHERFAGETKYPLKKMLALAFDGITSFSTRPIRMITLLGVGILGLSIIGLIVLLFLKIFGQTVAGWTTIMGSIWLIGGVQIFCIGLVGEYIGKIYSEVKDRPRFIIEEFLD